MRVIAVLCGRRADFFQFVEERLDNTDESYRLWPDNAVLEVNGTRYMAFTREEQLHGHHIDDYIVRRSYDQYRNPGLIEIAASRIRRQE